MGTTQVYSYHDCCKHGQFIKLNLPTCNNQPMDHWVHKHHFNYYALWLQPHSFKKARVYVPMLYLLRLLHLSELQMGSSSRYPKHHTTRICRLPSVQRIWHWKVESPSKYKNIKYYSVSSCDQKYLMSVHEVEDVHRYSNGKHSDDEYAHTIINYKR